MDIDSLSGIMAVYCIVLYEHIIKDWRQYSFFLGFNINISTW